jgi:4-hydroxy-3-methylbut-2-enyl diphosphate reductase
MPIQNYILNDPEVELAQRAGGSLRFGQWLIRLPRRFGFCGGVLSALSLLQQTLANQPAGRVLLLGDIIHNDTVNDRLRADGVIILPETNIADVLKQIRDGDTVVIPAFGVPGDLAASLQAQQETGRIRLTDTTCRYVRRIWEFVEQEAAAGATVLILGKPEHPENRATLSRALAAGNAVIQLATLETAGAFAEAVEIGKAIGEQLQAIPKLIIHNPGSLNLKRLAFAAQTTLLHSEVMAAETRLRQTAAVLNAGFASAASVCNATRERQQAALELCESGSDLFIVIGGFASSNTTQLQRLASQHAPTYFIRSAADFNATRISHYDPDSQTIRHTGDWLPTGPATIGLLSGASCPASDIGGVICKLRDLAMESDKKNLQK